MIPSVVIISTFKPLIPEFIVEHTNSLQSWKRLRCKPKIVIIGDDQGVAELCANARVIHHPYVKKNNYGTPMINSIFEEGWKYVKDDDICVFVNGDIILTDSLCDTLDAFVNNFPDYAKRTYFMTAVRNNWYNFTALDFNDAGLKSIPEKNLKRERPDGIDLFIHRKGTYLNIPDSGIAKFAYDTWLLLYAIDQFELCIDITETCQIIHHMGKWYQDNKACNRGVQSQELKENSQKLNGINCHYVTKLKKPAIITSCPFYTKFINNKIVFEVK